MLYFVEALHPMLLSLMKIGFPEHVLALELGRHVVSNFGFRDHLMSLEKLFNVFGNVSLKFDSNYLTCQLGCSHGWFHICLNFKEKITLQRNSNSFKFVLSK